MKRHLLAAAIVLALFSGCATDESPAFLRVHNETNQALVVFAFPDGALVDLLPHLPLGGYGGHMVLAGHSLDFDKVPGYQAGKGVFLAIYVVQTQGADLAMTKTVTDAELKVFRRQVTIDALPCPACVNQQ